MVTGVREKTCSSSITELYEQRTESPGGGIRGSTYDEKRKLDGAAAIEYDFPFITFSHFTSCEVNIQDACYTTCVKFEQQCLILLTNNNDIFTINVEVMFIMNKR